MIRRRKFIILIFIGLSSLLLLDCSSSSSSQDSAKWNLSAIYNPLSTKLHPVYSVYHNSDNSSLLYLKVFTSELRFQPVASGVEAGMVSVSAVLYEIDNNKSIVADSLNYELTIKKSTKKRYYSQLPLKTEMGKKYQLKIVLRDKLRKTFNLQFLDIDKRDINSSQNFSIVNNAGLPHFSNVLKPSALYRLKHRSAVSGKLYISYFGKEVAPPKSTFASPSDNLVFKKADSIWVLDYGPKLLLQFSYPGLYYFQFDTADASGLTTVCYGDNFPKIKSVEEMIDPMSFLATEAEFAKLKASPNPKLSSDKFWLDIGGSTSRGREMIRIFYNRVYFANYFFTGSRQGWKTDRGMVYVVYGPPQGLKKSGTSETWSYYPGQGQNPINFTFRHKPSKYCFENYVLDRGDSQEWHWKEVVDAWRSGDIYLLD